MLVSVCSLLKPITILCCEALDRRATLQAVGWGNTNLIFLIRIVQVSVKLTHIFNLAGGFKYFLCSPLFGEDSHFD